MVKPSQISLRYANKAFDDLGFVKLYPNKKTLQIYSFGQPVYNIEVDDFVCVNGGCVSKERFTKSFFGCGLAPDTIDRVLTGSKLPGFDAQNAEGGFVQASKKDGCYDFSYSVINGETVYRDRFKNVFLRIKEE